MPDTLRGGVIEHDHFKPFSTLPGVEHALCKAHHPTHSAIEVDT